MRKIWFLSFFTILSIDFNKILYILKPQKKCMKLKKNQSSTKQKKEKISDIELKKGFIQKTKIRFCLSLNQKTTIHLTRMKKLEYPLIYRLIKLEGFVSICLYLLKKKLDSRTVFSQTKSLGSQMGKRWYEYENGKLGIILSKNI